MTAPFPFSMLSACAALLLPLPAGAEPLDRAAVQALAGPCASCHGPDGRSPGAIPSIAGLPAEHTAQRMLAFRAAADTAADPAATVMPRLMKGYDEAQIRALAAWFAEARP